MFWFDVVGLSLSFISSVLLSIGLLKPAEQIKAENSTYFDANPYTLRNNMESRKFNILGITLLITGFAITLSGVVAERFQSHRALIGVLLSTTLIFMGVAFIPIVMLYRKRSHQIYESELAKKHFISLVKSQRDNLKQLTNKSYDFDRDKASHISKLTIRFNTLTEESSYREKDLLSDLDNATNIDEYLYALEKYLGLIEN